MFEHSSASYDALEACNACNVAGEAVDGKRGSAHRNNNVGFAVPQASLSNVDTSQGQFQRDSRAMVS
jgi:hypothetical protein